MSDNTMTGAFELLATPYGTTWRGTVERLKVNARLIGTDYDYTLVFENNYARLVDRLHRGDRLYAIGRMSRHKPKYGPQQVNVLWMSEESCKKKYVLIVEWNDTDTFSTYFFRTYEAALRERDEERLKGNKANIYVEVF